MKAIDDLKVLLETSRLFLHKCHAACNGFQDGSKCKAFVETYRDAALRLQKKFPEHPMKVNIEKVDRLASEVLWREARQMEEELEPLFLFIQDIARYQQRTVQFLLYVDQAILQHVDRADHLSMDYTPELLTGYMTLFCNAVRLQILACGMPRALIIQLYTLAVNLGQLKAEQPLQDPPSREQLISHIQSYQDPYSRMETDFKCISHRVFQILESTAFPAILSMTSLEALRATKLLDVQAIVQNKHDLPESIAQNRPGWRSLKSLQQLKEWAIFGVLVCPEEAVLSEQALPVIKILLEDTMQVRIYKDVFEWLHPIFQMHVRPALLEAKQLPSDHRKAFLKVAKHLISNCHETASATCMLRHQHARMFAADTLSNIYECFRADPVYLTHFREMIFAALAYARQEVLWYFSHVNEDPPVSAIKAMLSGPNPFKRETCCPTVSVLLTSMMKVHDLVLQYRSAIHAEVQSEISTDNDRLIRPSITNLKTIERHEPNGELLQLIAELTELSNMIDEFPAPDNEDPEHFLASVRCEWERLALGLVSNTRMITCQDLERATGNVSFLQTIAMVMQQSHFLEGHDNYLSKVCNLADLNLHPTKFLDAIHDAVGGTASHLANITGWLFALSQGQVKPYKALPSHTPSPIGFVSPNATPARHGFGALSRSPGPSSYEPQRAVKVQTAKPFHSLNQDTDGAHVQNDSTETSSLDVEALTQIWRETVASRMTNLILTVAQSSFQALNARLDMAEMVQAHNTSMQERNTVFAIVQPSVQTDAGLAGLAIKEDAGQLETVRSAYISEFQETRALADGLQSDDFIKVTDSLAICPRTILEDCVSRAITENLEACSFHNQVLQNPLIIAKSHQRLVSLIIQIGQNVGADFKLCIKEGTLAVLVTQTDNGSLARQISDWLFSNIVGDSSPKHIVMAPARQSFMSTNENAKGINAELYTSPSALDALVSTFGGYLLHALASTATAALRQGISAMESLLTSHAVALKALHSRLAVKNEVHLWESCRLAASQVADMGGITDAMQSLARVLYFRQLLAQSVARVYAKQLPAMAANLRLVGQSSHEDLLYTEYALRPPHQQQEADGLLVSLLLEGTSSRRLTLWAEFHILAGLSMQGAPRGATAFSPIRGLVSGKLDSLATMVPAFIRAHCKASEEIGQPTQSAQQAMQDFERCARTSLASHRLDMGARQLSIAQAMQKLRSDEVSLASAAGTNTIAAQAQSAQLASLSLTCLSQALQRSTHQMACALAVQAGRKG